MFGRPSAAAERTAVRPPPPPMVRMAREAVLGWAAGPPAHGAVNIPFLSSYDPQAFILYLADECTPASL